MSWEDKGDDEESRGSEYMDRSRRHRQCVPCKQARRDVSGDVPNAVSICRERSVRADVDNKNPDMDVRKHGPMKDVVDEILIDLLLLP
jgi:hypothetical protein